MCCSMFMRIRSAVQCLKFRAFGQGTSDGKKQTKMAGQGRKICDQTKYKAKNEVKSLHTTKRGHSQFRGLLLQSVVAFCFVYD